MTAERSLRADARRNRARLLEVAERVFAAEGLSAPIDEIARQAEVGVGTLYRHFPTKEALFGAIVIDRVRQVIDRARELAHAPDPGEAFYEFFTYLVEQTAANKALYSALSERAGLDLAPTSDIGHELNEVQGDLLVRAQRSGAVRSDIDVSDLKALISGALAMQQHGASPELMLAILCDGLRPR